MKFQIGDMTKFCRVLEHIEDGVLVDAIEVVQNIPADVPETISLMRATLADGRVLAMIKPGDKFIITGQPQGA